MCVLKMFNCVSECLKCVNKTREKCLKSVKGLKIKRLKKENKSVDEKYEIESETIGWIFWVSEVKKQKAKTKQKSQKLMKV